MERFWTSIAARPHCKPDLGPPAVL
jgi:hypothetical protein